MIFSITTPDGQPPNPAVCEALREAATLAIAQLQGKFPVVEEPPHDSGGAGQYSASDTANKEPSIHTE